MMKPTETDKLVEQAYLQSDFSDEELVAFAAFLRGPLGLKMLAHLLTMEDACKDKIALCDFTTPKGVSDAQTAQGEHRALRRFFELLLSLKPQEETQNGN